MAMGSATIKGSDAIEYAKIMEIVGKAFEKKSEKEVEGV